MFWPQSQPKRPPVHRSELVLTIRSREKNPALLLRSRFDAAPKTATAPSTGKSSLERGSIV